MKLIVSLYDLYFFANERTQTTSIYKALNINVSILNFFESKIRGERERESK